MWPFKKTMLDPVADYGIITLYESARPWLGLLQTYRIYGRRTEFEIIACRLREEFNLQLVRWDGDDPPPAGEEGLWSEQYSHILERLVTAWGSEACVIYLEGLLAGNRKGTRAGFPLAVFDDLLMLYGVVQQLRGGHHFPNDRSVALEAHCHAL